MSSSHDRVIRDIISRAADARPTRLYLMVCELGRLVLRTRARRDLLSQVCRTAVEIGGLSHASVSLVQPDGAGLTETAHHGVDLGNGSLGESVRRAALREHGEQRHSGPIVFGDLLADERFAASGPVLRQAGLRSAAALFLPVHGRAKGLLTLYSEVAGFFGPEELDWLEKAAADLGHALEALERDAARKRAEEALSGSERRFREILQRVNLVAVVLGVDGCITFCNEFGARLLGWGRTELIGKNWFENFLPPENRAQVWHVFFDNIVAGSIPVHYQNEILTRDGRLRMISWSNSVLCDPDGSVVGTASIGEDITERRAAEEALRASEERYRFLFNANPLPMWVVDTATRRFLAANDAAVRQYGYSREEFLAMSVDEVRAAEDDAVPGDVFPGFPGSTVRHRRKDGSLMNVEVRGFAIMYGARPARLIAAQDVSEMKQLEEQLRQSQKIEAIGRLAGGVAHDFNNILMAIQGYTELALAGMPPDDSHRPDLEEVRKAAGRGAELTRQLLAFSRRQILQPEILDLNSVVAEMQRMLLRIIGADIQLVTRFDPHLCRVRADRGRIGQVLLNLVVNARDAMPQGGKLVIETSNAVLDDEYARTHAGVVPGAYAMIAVTDTGTGITPSVRAHLFEPFFTTKEKDKGSGFGLSTVYGIVRQSGGHIWVYSEVGHGAAFKIYLPDVQVPAPRATPDVPALPRGGSETVLLVEDDAPLRALTRRLLEQFGYRVREAAGADQAAAALREETGVDLLLTDFVLPNVRGPELARRLRRIRPGLKVLYMSGYSEALVADAAKHPVASVCKPFTPDQLAARIREVLDAPAKKQK